MWKSRRTFRRWRNLVGVERWHPRCSRWDRRAPWFRHLANSTLDFHREGIFRPSAIWKRLSLVPTLTLTLTLHSTTRSFRSFWILDPGPPRRTVASSPRTTGRQNAIGRTQALTLSLDGGRTTCTSSSASSPSTISFTPAAPFSPTHPTPTTNPFRHSRRPRSEMVPPVDNRAVPERSPCSSSF